MPPVRTSISHEVSVMPMERGTHQRRNNSARVKASNTMPGADAGCGGDARPQGLCMSIGVDSVAEGQRVFEALARDGRVAMPFAAAFWSPGFGMVTDRFGTPWMVNV